MEEIVTHPLLSVSRRSGEIGSHIGSVIYRGENFPSLAGRLVYASRDGQIVIHDVEANGKEPAAPVTLDLGPLARKSIHALRTTPRGELILLCEDGSIVALTKGKVDGLEKSAKKSLYCETTLHALTARQG